MVKVRYFVTAGAAFALIFAGVYRFGLSEEARNQVRKTASSVAEACRRINEVISPTTEGEVTPEDLPNRQATAAQWRSLGY